MFIQKAQYCVALEAKAVCLVVSFQVHQLCFYFIFERKLCVLSAEHGILHSF